MTMMTDKPDTSLASATPSVRPARPLVRRSRALMLLGMALFVVSLAFPIFASLAQAELVPSWLGWLDVVVAFAVVTLMVVIDLLAQGRVDDDVKQFSYRVYRLMANLLIILLIIFFLFGDTIRWNVLLPGLAWRMWALMRILPAGLAVWRINVL